ncbi:hypothetical protein EVAR_23903_1 [Eumeta japonica]|uniref:Uncharacterized protein n=1 Tax=Eumeta variegata TaxID=151549 RepID=A0A4C1V4R6_EUMVA|nr:hypothetical protein EVAR_23903_1 [Eumeta japonica]
MNRARKMDAAAKAYGTSLNCNLFTGPDLLQSLPGVLMKFRQHQIAVTADIKKMFLQIEIRKKDHGALRFSSSSAIYVKSRTILQHGRGDIPKPLHERLSQKLPKHSRSGPDCERSRSRPPPSPPRTTEVDLQ